MVCPQCGAPARAGDRFCGRCGFRLEAQERARPARARSGSRRAERRQITVLFYDLVGSTALAETCDPEEFSELVDALHARVTERVTALGGFAGARVGDGGVAYFGYPEAREDAAERAVRAGLSGLEVASALRLPDGSQARLRVGVATGQGVVAQGERLEGGNEVVGGVANLAARLQSLAPPGGLVISDETRRLVEDHLELTDLGRLRVRGLPAPVRCWRVLGGHGRGRMEALAGGDTPLVGRARERRALARALERARAGAGGSVVVVTGEAGLGKSRLVADLSRHAEQEGVLILHFDCAAHRQEAPLSPFVEHLHRRRHATERAQRTSGLPAASIHLGPEAPADDLILLDRLAGLRGGEEPPEVKRLTPAQRLDRTIDALIRQIELCGRRAPVLVVMEDAHWADPTSLALLDRAVTRGLHGRTLLVVTARPEFRPVWRNRLTVEPLALAPLRREEAAAVIESVAGARSLSPELREAVIDRSDGVPLYLEELTRSLVATADGPTAGPGLPLTLQDSLLARLDRLGGAKEVAQLAAVIGRRFDFLTLALLSEHEPEGLRRDLSQLIEAGIVCVERAPQDGYLFRHVLIQEAAYDTLLRSERRRLNARLIEAIMTAAPSVAEAEPERLARYAEEAALFDKAGRFWLRAGVHALLQSAMPEALSRLRRGLASVAQLDAGDARWRLELELQLTLGKALIATAGYAAAETRTTFERARSLCETVDVQARLLPVLHGLWINDLLCGRLESARRRAAELVSMADRSRDGVWLLVGRRLEGVLDFVLGELPQAQACLEEGLALFDPARRADYADVLVDDTRVVLLVYLGWVRAYRGDLEEARRASDAALAEARSLGQAYSLAHALVGRILCGLFIREAEELEPLVEELSQLTRDHGVRYYAAVCELLNGRRLVLSGRLEAGVDGLRAGLKAYRATGSALYLPTFLGWLADGLRRGGRLDEARRVLEEARAVADSTGMLNNAAELLRLSGELHLAGGDTSSAERDLVAAGELARTQGAWLFHTRAAASLGAIRTRAAEPRPHTSADFERSSRELELHMGGRL